MFISFVWGVFVRGGFGKGGFCPGGFCPGGFCPDTEFHLGSIVPSDTSQPCPSVGAGTSMQANGPFSKLLLESLHVLNVHSRIPVKVELKMYQKFLAAAEIHLYLNHKLQQHDNSVLRLPYKAHVNSERADSKSLLISHLSPNLENTLW